MSTKIYTRSINYELYRMSGHCLGLSLPRVRLVNTTADGYFYRMLRDTDCDWAINIDEDAFVVNAKAILELLDYMQRNGYVNCGMSDGILVRPYNPAVTNPFFNILNLKAIRESFIPDEIRDFDYEKHRDVILSKLPPTLQQIDEERMTMTNEEPYYKFFLWLAYRFRTLYLDAEMHPDGISTILKNHEGTPMLYHSWFSREWRRSPEHTARIIHLYKETCSLRDTTPYLPQIWALISPPERQLQILQRKTHNAFLRVINHISPK